jgi:hypothetical protein
MKYQYFKDTQVRRGVGMVKLTDNREMTENHILFSK